MTHGEAPMTHEVRMTHNERPRPRFAFRFRAWSLIGHWALGIRHCAPGATRPASCTQIERDSDPERSECGSVCQAGTLDASAAVSLHNTWKSSCVGRGVRLRCKKAAIRAAGSSSPIAYREGLCPERGGFPTGAASMTLGWACATELGGKELPAAYPGSGERLGSQPSPCLGVGSSITQTSTFRGSRVLVHVFGPAGQTDAGIRS